MNEDNKIIPFIYDESPVRVVTDENDNPWFVAKDVCRVLEIEWKGAGETGSLASLDEDERGRYKVPTPGGAQEITCISESGLYTLIIRSNKPAAKPFRRWVTHEVLPELRKTGQYAINEAMFAESRTTLSELTKLITSAVLMMDRLEKRLYALEAKNSHSKVIDGDFLAAPEPNEFFEFRRAQLEKISTDVRNFLIARTKIDPDGSSLLSWLYAAYEQWCFANGKIKATTRKNRLYITGISLKYGKE